MAYLNFENIGISAVSACVPSKVVYNRDLLELIGPENLEKVINSTGVEEKRYAEDDVCASDLCLKAAEKLIVDNKIDKSEIDALIFVSQTSDYHQPATAPLLQHKLGLSTSTLSFDINLACSGYVYGLSVAFSLARDVNVRKVLLLVGETMSKTISQRDKVSAPLFGDAGTATLIEKGDFGKSLFSLNSDGAGSDVIKMPYGGYRNPSSIDGFKDQIDADGNIRNGEQFFMDGMAVFNFGMKVEPADIKKLVKQAGIDIQDIDLIIYHQANKSMTDFFTRWLKFSYEKTPYCIKKYGNTSSASIPLTISSEMAEEDKYPERKRVILSGFGAGLSWASALLDLSLCKVSKIVEY